MCVLALAFAHISALKPKNKREHEKAKLADANALILSQSMSDANMRCL
jgi:hypothetical protein